MRARNSHLSLGLKTAYLLPGVGMSETFKDRLHSIEIVFTGIYIVELIMVRFQCCFVLCLCDISSCFYAKQ